MRWDAVDERRLVKRVIAGDREAAERLLAREYPDVFRFLLFLTGHRDEAEELAQETIVKAWQRLDAFEGRSTLRTWLHRVAYREYGARRRQPSSAEPMDKLDDGRQSFVDSLVEALAIERAIAALPDPLRVTFLLCRVQEMSAREASEILGVPTGTVLSRLHAARDHLRRQLTVGEIATGATSSEPTIRSKEGPHNHEMSKAVR